VNVDAPAEIDRSRLHTRVAGVLRGGPEGNARLTTITAAVLLILLAA